jgi:hypothetical protein
MGGQVNNMNTQLSPMQMRNESPSSKPPSSIAANLLRIAGGMDQSSSPGLPPREQQQPSPSYGYTSNPFVEEGSGSGPESKLNLRYIKLNSSLISRISLSYLKFRAFIDKQIVISTSKRCLVFR